MIIYILPHAGGSAYFYRSLENLLKKEMDVCTLELPGHGRRAKENLICDMEELANDMLNYIQPGYQKWTIFGHSMGALLAYAICSILEDEKSYPEHLFLSGTSSPFHRKNKTSISSLPEAEFWKAIMKYGGISEEVLKIKELKEYFEPILRCDFKAVENYRPQKKRLNISFSVFYGLDDMSYEEAYSWQELTYRKCNVYGFEGGHFFFSGKEEEIVRIIVSTLINNGQLVR